MNNVFPFKEECGKIQVSSDWEAERYMLTKRLEIARLSIEGIQAWIITSGRQCQMGTMAQTCPFELLGIHMRNHTLAPHVACASRGSFSAGPSLCWASRSIDLPRHPPQIYNSSMEEHADHVCHIMLQPKLVPALPKPLSLSSESFEWELTALLFHLTMCPALLLVFGTQTLGNRGTAGHYLCLHKGIFCSSPGIGWCVPSLRSKKSAVFFQHDPLSGWQLFPLLFFALQGAATCAMSPPYLPVPPAQPSHQVSLSVLCLINLL